MARGRLRYGGAGAFTQGDSHLCSLAVPTGMCKSAGWEFRGRRIRGLDCGAGHVPRWLLIGEEIVSAAGWRSRVASNEAGHTSGMLGSMWAMA